MDIEDLSKSQLLLLTILVNFVVAIATAVMTVSLLDQAPTTVTQTVNRIVDHTIETVTTEVPVLGNAPSAPSTEELLTAAIAENTARRVRIYEAGNDAVAAVGVYVPSARSVVTVSTGLPGHITVEFANGTRIEADRIKEDGNLKAYGFAAEASIPQVPAARVVPSAEVKQGQTVIALTADGSVITGIVSKVDDTGVYVDTPAIPVGASAVNLSGDLIGISGGGSLLMSGDRVAALFAP